MNRKPTIYTPHTAFKAKVDLTRCRAAVHEGGRGVGFHQCTKKGTKSWTDPDSGLMFLFCTGKTGHHPDDEAARDAERRKRWDEKEAAETRQRVRWGLAGATDEELLAEVERRGLR